MTLKPSVWYPIAGVLALVNWVGIGLAAGAREPMHAGIHVVGALAFTWWALRLRDARTLPGDTADLEQLEVEMTDLRQQLAETQERLDFAERMLAQRPEPPRMGPER